MRWCGNSWVLSTHRPWTEWSDALKAEIAKFRKTHTRKYTLAHFRIPGMEYWLWQRNLTRAEYKALREGGLGIRQQMRANDSATARHEALDRKVRALPPLPPLPPLPKKPIEPPQWITDQLNVEKPRPNESFPLYTAGELAQMLEVSSDTLRRWRMRGGGPMFIRESSRCVVYLKKDVDLWLETHRQRVQTSYQKVKAAARKREAARRARVRK